MAMTLPRGDGGGQVGNGDGPLDGLLKEELGQHGGHNTHDGDQQGIDAENHNGRNERRSKGDEHVPHDGLGVVLGPDVGCGGHGEQLHDLLTSFLGWLARNRLASLLLVTRSRRAGQT